MKTMNSAEKLVPVKAFGSTNDDRIAVENKLLECPDSFAPLSPEQVLQILLRVILGNSLLSGSNLGEFWVSSVREI